MQLNDLLKLKFPTANFRKDILLQNDGEGIYIKEWNLANVNQPTSDEILTWSIDPTLVASYTAQQNAITNAPIIAQLEAIDMKTIRALRENDTVRIAQFASDAAALRAQLV